MAGTPPQVGIVENAVALLAKSPQFIFLLAAARLSGQGWLYIIVTCNNIPAARIKYLNNHSGITVLGLLSFVPAMVLLHWIINGFKRFEYESSLEIIASAVMCSLAMQLVALLLTIYWNRAR